MILSRRQDEPAPRWIDCRGARARVLRHIRSDCEALPVSLNGLIALFLIWQCSLAVTWGQSPIQLREVTGQTGITFQHTDGSSGRHYIMETVSAGLALFDFDGDGDTDIYFVNGSPLKGTVVESPPTNALYRNDGNFRFTDVTREAGVGDTGYGLGVAAADYDNDGDLDLYVTNYGPHVFYRNNGDGTFSDVTEETRTGKNDHVGAGACFLDFDGDGFVDLFVASYLQFSYDTHVEPTHRGFRVYPSPEFFPPAPSYLYRNNGDGTFTDVSVESGIAKHVAWGMGTVCADYDNDGDTDIFVDNDGTANYLFRNDGTGKFQEVGLAAGIAYDLQGNAHGSMGVDCGDYNNDGWLDFHQTSYQTQLALLYENLGGGLFEDVTLRVGAGSGTQHLVTWGNAFVDFDNDGHRDLFIACGHLLDNVDLFDDRTSYRAQNILLRNDGQGAFVNVSNTSGDGMLPKFSSRGAAFDDLDNDGDIDAVILNSRERPTILRNDSETGNHWLQILLRGVRTNASGVGARVRVVSGKSTWIDEVHSGRSYQSHFGMRLHFGLGQHDRVDRIEVRWVGGGVDVLEDLPVDRLVTIVEQTNASGS